MNTTQNQVLTVSQLNFYVRSLLEGDSRLQSLYVTGEISNFAGAFRSGHLYFSLKDAGGVVRCVMFADKARRLHFLPENGMKVWVRGRVSLYEAGGQYQLYCEEMQPVGAGALSVAFEQLKRKLEQEGLFDPARKKPIPAYPETICVITSPTGAALQDILSILRRRWPVAQINLLPVLVQGKEASGQIAAALQRANQENLGDVILVGRGGGSLEDLWAFNEEETARAVAASHIPVISAVGHETDFTICDFVADLRAPTPSAAAELVSPDQMEIKALLWSMENRMQQCLRDQLDTYRAQLNRFHPSLLSGMILQKSQQLDLLSHRCVSATQHNLTQKGKNLAALAARLDALSPLKVLCRGYAWVEKEGHSVPGVTDLQPGDTVDLHFMDGEAVCQVQATKEESKP